MSRSTRSRASEMLLIARTRASAALVKRPMASDSSAHQHVPSCSVASSMSRRALTSNGFTIPAAFIGYSPSNFLKMRSYSAARRQVMSPSSSRTISRTGLLWSVSYTHVGPGRGRRLVQRQVEDFAAELGTEILACIPISDRIGVYLSTLGHHYRPAAERICPPGRSEKKGLECRLRLARHSGLCTSPAAVADGRTRARA
jgi:hypothetical protein